MLMMRTHVLSGRRHKVPQMRSATRGNAAEAAVLSALVNRGFDVLVPFGGGQPYDLVLHLTGAAFLRVQCKTAWRSGDCLAFNCCSTDHGRGRQPYGGLADIFGVYSPEDRSIYLVPVHAVARFQGRLRLKPTRNNQLQRVRFAADFAIDVWDSESLMTVAESARLASAIA